MRVPHLDDQPYAELIARQCSIVVAENSMKWGPIHPQRDRYDFAAADRLVNFAEKHGLAIRGHNLCWHEANPPWLAATATRQNAEHLLTSHIETVVSRYAGKIHSWDVVNEAINPKDNQPDGLRNSLWFQLLGPRYLEIAFHAAHAADPHALLTYNDYGIENDSPGDTAKREAVLSLVRRLKDANAPIGAIGVQSHLKISNELRFGEGLRAFLASTRQLGLKSMITELDVDGPTDAAVAEVYRKYLNLVLPEPSMIAVLTWGITDRYSWLNGRAKKAGRPNSAPSALRRESATDRRLPSLPASLARETTREFYRVKPGARIRDHT